MGHDDDEVETGRHKNVGMGIEVGITFVPSLKWNPELKLAHIDIYNKRLAEREKRKRCPLHWIGVTFRGCYPVCKSGCCP